MGLLHRITKLALTISALAIAFVSYLAYGSASERRPNVLLILADDND
jgi:hypothetical protein